MSWGACKFVSSQAYKFMSSRVDELEGTCKLVS